MRITHVSGACAVALPTILELCAENRAVSILMMVRFLRSAWCGEMGVLEHDSLTEDMSVFHNSLDIMGEVLAFLSG